MPEDVIVFFYVHNPQGKVVAVTNSKKWIKAKADEVGGYIVAEGQSGKTKVIYNAMIVEEDSDVEES